MTSKAAARTRTGVITPMLTVDNAAKAIEFYVRAFGAEEIMCMRGPDSKVMHAEIKLFESLIYINDEFPSWGVLSPKSAGGVQSSKLHLYVGDVDKFVEKAVREGATLEHPPTDMFWGDRDATINDPFGYKWSIATHLKDLTPEELKKGQEEFLAQMAQGKGCGE
jgi:PhnB protein